MRRTLFALGTFYLVITIALYFGQRWLMFSTSSEQILPAELGLDMQEITQKNTTGERRYSWYNSSNLGRPTVLYLHGNGGSISSRHELQRQFLDRGYNLFMVGYPGYGGSEGQPSEPSFINAAQQSYQHLIQTGTRPENIILFGESLGSAVAVQLATKVQARALVLAAPMASIEEIAAAQYPIFPIRWLLKDKFRSLDHIGNVHTPLLIFHGTEDEAMPITSGKALFELANEPKKFEAISGGGHNNLFSFGILDSLDRFLEKQTESPSKI